MVISNEQKTRETGLWFSLIITFFTITFLASILIEKAQVWWLQIPAAALVVIAILFYRFGGFHYIRAEFNNQNIEIKFYNSFPYGRKFRMIKVTPSQITRMKIKKGCCGIGKGLVLYQKTNKNEARYPFIGLSALNANDRNRILLHLEKK
ncbi:MAG: hypothetical protein JXR39_03080 [Marinilabiliaceae bacterium]|nr:hypothetical protein [Marinilabiliaceae bacterium]